MCRTVKLIIPGEVVQNFDTEVVILSMSRSIACSSSERDPGLGDVFVVIVLGKVKYW